MSKCKNTFCPFCGKCSATMCERYIDHASDNSSSTAVMPNEYVTFTTTNSSAEVVAHFDKKVPNDVAYINQLGVASQKND